jgi:hypothetical protein
MKKGDFITTRCGVGGVVASVAPWPLKYFLKYPVRVTLDFMGYGTTCKYTLNGKYSTSGYNISSLDIIEVITPSQKYY